MKGIVLVRTEDTMANFQFLQPAWDILLNDRRRHGHSRLLGERSQAAAMGDTGPL
jgi:hypothetical protein